MVRFRPVELARLPQLDARLRVEPHDEARAVETDRFRAGFFFWAFGPEPGIPLGISLFFTYVYVFYVGLIAYYTTQIYPPVRGMPFYKMHHECRRIHPW